MAMTTETTLCDSCGIAVSEQQHKTFEGKPVCDECAHEYWLDAQAELGYCARCGNMPAKWERAGLRICDDCAEAASNG